jgi:sugar/nucleoside kinase (ribokinase family)
MPNPYAIYRLCRRVSVPDGPRGQVRRPDRTMTTGAGDVFHGAYIYGLCQNWKMAAIVKYACAAAALKCRRPGGRLGIPSLDEVEEFIRR